MVELPRRETDSDPGAELWLALWFPVSNPLLRDEVSAPFEAFGEAVGAILERQSLRCYEGAISGATHVKLCFPLDSGGNPERAARLVVASLKERGWETRAIMARCRGFDTPKAVWPPGYRNPLPR